MSKLFKRTKILATVGPAVFDAEKIEEMIKSKLPAKTEVGISDFLRKGIRLFSMFATSKLISKTAIILTIPQASKPESPIFGFSFRYVNLVIIYIHMLKSVEPSLTLNLKNSFIRIIVKLVSTNNTHSGNR